MKKLKIIFLLLLAATLCMSFVACDQLSSPKTPLSTPVVELEGDTIYWMAIPNAVGYEISIAGQTTTVDATVISYKLTSGQSAQVRAIGDKLKHLDSSWSAPVVYNASQPHSCQNVCPTCGKCTNTACTESVCADKCQGHATTTPHTCQNVCPTCGKCTNIACTESVCADKCPGHSTTTPHTCHNVCPTCGKCANQYCDEDVCADKCPGHATESYTDIITLLGFNNVRCTIKGLVVARNARSFVVTDDTGSILVYMGSDWDKGVSVGDMVTVSGITTVYGNATQFGSDSKVEVLSNDNTVTHPTAEALDGNDFIGVNLFIKYVTVDAVINISGSHVNFAFTPNGGLTGSINYPEQVWDSYNGQTVTLTGYATGVTSSQYLNLMVTSFQPKDDNGNEDEEGQSTVINLFSINDNHGDFYQNDNGIDKLAAGINALSGEHNIKIANGDILQGTYVSSSQFGLPMIDALNAMDFDCFVLGNHEFDWGLDKIARFADGDPANGEASFPFLGANIIEKATGTRPEWIQPYTVVEVGGIKVGIIGLIGEYQESSILATHSDPYDFVNGDSYVYNYSAELRLQHGCDVVVVAIHDYDDGSEFTATLQRWASYSGNNNVDAIFCAHSHQRINTVVYGSDGDAVPVLQNGGNGQTFAKLAITLDNNNDITDKLGGYYYTSNYTSDGTLDSVIEDHMEVIERGSSVIANGSPSMSKSQLGTLAATLMAEQFDADFGLINTGGVRSTIDAGEVSVSDVFQVFPFENEVIVFQIEGSLLKSYLTVNDGYNYYCGSVNSIVSGQTYTVAMIDYVFFGYRFDDFRPETYTNTHVLMRDLMIQHFEQQ